MTLTDPNGQQSNIAATETINAISGTYTLAAAPVVSGSNTYHATQTVQTVTVTSGAVSTVTVDYYNVIPNTTKILDQTGSQSIAISTGGTTLTISSASPVAQSLKPGDVLVSGPVTAAPHGFLVKVSAVTVGPSAVVATVAPATLADEVVQARFGVDIPFTVVQPASAVTLNKGSPLRATPETALANPCASVAQHLTLPFSYSLPPDQNQNTVTASGELDFCNLHVDFDVRPLSLYAEATATLQQYSTLVIQGQYSTTFDLNEPLNLSSLEDQVACLGNETCQDVLNLPDSIGNALAVVSGSITPFVGIAGSTSGAFYAGGAETGTFQAGAQAQGTTISPVFSGALQQQPFPAALDGTLDVKPYFGITFAVQLFGSATFHVDPRMYAELKADTAANPWWTLNLGDEALAGLTLSYFGFGSQELDTPEFTIYSGQLAQASGAFTGQPALTGVTPNGAAQFGPVISLTVVGSNFVPGCSVTFNGTPIPTSYGDPNSLTAVVPANLLAVSGLDSIAVANSQVTGTISNSLPFTVTASTTNPVPAITYISPNLLEAGSSPQNLNIFGTGFLPSSTVTLNHGAHTVTYLSVNELAMPLTAADLAAAGALPLVVTNSTPGGGASNTVSFTVLGPGVDIMPASVNVAAGEIQTFAAIVSSGGGVAWSVVEGSSGGTISTTGIYSAPNQTGTYHIQATSISNPSYTATAAVTVIAGPVFQTLHSFDHTKEGAVPWAPLVLNTDGYFYGVTEAGGNASCSYIASLTGCGTVYRTDASGIVTTLYSFSGQDGAYPVASLTPLGNGTLYGTTNFGGTDIAGCAVAGSSVLAGCGTVFSLSSGSVTSIATFGPYASALGAGPAASLLVAQDGSLYGTTSVGGDTVCTGTVDGYYESGCGNVFRLSIGGEPTRVHNFASQDGAYPTATLVQGTDGNFYGTVGGGGLLTCSSYDSPGCGAVYRMTPSGIVSVLHSFNGQDGATPYSPLIISKDGSFYGATLFGGDTSCSGGASWQGCGTVFHVDSSGTFSSLHSFSGLDGAYPTGLIQGSDGYFYGTTEAGGDTSCTGRYGPGCGTVFRMDSAGNVTVLYSFTGQSDGSWPESGVIQGSDGNLYGTTAYGGVNDDGVIFQISNLTSLNPALTGTRTQRGAKQPITPLLTRRPHVGLSSPAISKQH